MYVLVKALLEFQVLQFPLLVYESCDVLLRHGVDHISRDFDDDALLEVDGDFVHLIFVATSAKEGDVVERGTEAVKY